MSDETPPNLVQIGDLYICEDEDAIPQLSKYSLLIQCSSASQCREAMQAGKIEFTRFRHYDPLPKNEGR